MKSLILLTLLAICFSSPFKKETKNLKVTPLDITNWISSFLTGFQFNNFVTPSPNCGIDITNIVNFTSISINTYASSQWYYGTLNFTSGLANLSNFTRDCDQPMNETAIQFGLYQQQFANLTDFLTKLTLNMMGNVFTIKSLSTQILNEYMTTRNMTKIFGLAGQLTLTVFQMN